MIQETSADLLVNFGILAVWPEEQSTITKPIHESSTEIIPMSALADGSSLHRACKHVRRRHPRYEITDRDLDHHLENAIFKDLANISYQKA